MVGSNIRDWGHVRVFTPWRYCVDPAATAYSPVEGGDAGWPMLFRQEATWSARIWSRLRKLPRTAVIETDAPVTAISRHGVDKVVSRERETRPFVLIVKVAGAFAAIWLAR